MKPKLSDLWRWDGAIDRRTYLFWGLFLLLAKVNCDRTIGWLWFDRSWSVFDWEQLKLYLWQTIPSSADRAYYLGFICILMAAPIALGLASAGAVAGYAIQKTIHWRRDSAGLFCVTLLAVPTTMGVEHWAPPPLPLLRVTTSVVVNAPPETVWRNVVSFSTLPPPHEILFRVGIAYPMSAEIRSTGPGVVRHCNFSTGPFVEPIEVWDEPRLLRFAVTINPEPMQEWTPYRHVHPAHLNGYLESRQGEFRLKAIEGNRTLVEGTTWYHHHLWPARYWQMWSNLIIHAIHRRVLDHVKALSEGGQR